METTSRKSDAKVRRWQGVLIAAAGWFLCAPLASAPAQAQGKLQLHLHEAQLADEADAEAFAEGGQHASSSDDAQDCCAPRPCDQIWLISTRCLGCPTECGGPPALKIYRLDPDGAWQPVGLHSFLAADDPGVPTDFYVHGNSVGAAEAVQEGMTVYRRLVACVPCDRPVRMVIWSWPTDKGKHPLQLLREHADRSDTDAWYLGWLVNRMNPDVKIGLAGYSFGARVVTGAMHLLGGGELCGMQLSGAAGDGSGGTAGLSSSDGASRRIIRGVLLAAAEDSRWLDPGAPNGQAIPLADHLLLLNNGCDRALRLYPHLYRCDPADALGYVGFHGDSDDKVEQMNVCCLVGKRHDWANYFDNPALVARMRPTLFLDAQ